MSNEKIASSIKFLEHSVEMLRDCAANLYNHIESVNETRDDVYMGVSILATTIVGMRQISEANRLVEEQFLKEMGEHCAASEEGNELNFALNVMINNAQEQVEQFEASYGGWHRPKEGQDEGPENS